ncbi:MAG: 3-oxo-tetronate 4-phosphate decarboxylase [Pseudomonadota bacterium]
MTEAKAREHISVLARSLFERGLTGGSSGNISQRVDGGYLMTPTGSTMRDLDPARISFLDEAGNHIGGDKPTKESFLHLAFFQVRPKVGAVVHLHSTYSVAVSCMSGLDETDVLPPLTPYYIMRIGTLPLVPYFAPGDARLADAVRQAAADHYAILLANHGPVVTGKSLEDAIYAMEELEETAKLFLTLQQLNVRLLTPQQVAELNERFPKDI